MRPYKCLARIITPGISLRRAVVAAGVVKNKTMKNLVSFETAKALKAAGFPQPKPEAGQFWYTVDESPKLAVITHSPEFNLGFTVLNGLHEVWMAEEDDIFTQATFAPTAADIQIEFYKDFHGVLDVGIRPHLGMDGEHEFCCLEKTGLQIDIRETAHCIKETPADATAIMYLNFAKARVIKRGHTLVYKDECLPALLGVKQMVEDGGNIGAALGEINKLGFY